MQITLLAGAELYFRLGSSGTTARADGTGLGLQFGIAKQWDVGGHPVQKNPLLAFAGIKIGFFE